MIDNRGTNRVSTITGNSVHSKRVERLHRDVCCGVLGHCTKIIDHLEALQELDSLDEVHMYIRMLYIMSFFFFLLINFSLTNSVFTTMSLYM